MVSRVEGNISIGQVISEYLSRDGRRVALVEVFVNGEKRYAVMVNDELIPEFFTSKRSASMRYRYLVKKYGGL